MNKNLSDAFDETFKESKGLPEVEHKKKLVKKEAEISKKLQDLRGVFFTFKNGKLLKLIAKGRGVHSVYLGREKTLGKAETIAMIEKWKKQGVYVEPHAIDSVLGKLVKDYAQKEYEILNGKK